MKIRCIQNLLLISCLLLTLTTCSNHASEVDSAHSVQESSNKDEISTVPDQKEEKTQQIITSKKTSTEPVKAESKNAKNDSAILNPKEISFEKYQFSDYLEDTIQPENVNVQIFGFNSPDGYTNDPNQDVLLNLENLGQASYASISNDGTGYLYIFALDQSAEVIRDYLKNDTWPKLCNFSNGITYPILLTGDSVNNIEKKDTLDTIYGSCDILFSELETSLTDIELLSIENPIYVESAYFSVKIPITETSLVTKDIAIMYMYSPDNKNLNEYQGYLKGLIPRMLTPINQ